MHYNLFDLKSIEMQQFKTRYYHTEEKSFIFVVWLQFPSGYGVSKSDNCKMCIKGFAWSITSSEKEPFGLNGKTVCEW